ncbi:MAG: GHKL domain-containing protein [Ruminococcaceae bacterium]|nr:GHKL domain-containing protein [Oscillospiraceae bacterium]
MTKKIFRSIILAVIAVLILSFSVVTLLLYNHFSNVSSTQLTDELSLAVQGVELSGEEYLKELQSKNYRLTLVAADGTVLYDTEAESAAMDNHKDREEIREAFNSGIGESERYSDTLTLKMIYRAEKLTDGSVLRISATQDSVVALLIDVLFPMIVIMILALIMSAFLARWLSKSIVKPLNTLDLENPADNDVYEELSPMLTKINKQHKQISKQMRELKKRADELEQIMTSMNEGLVLLDKSGAVISMNLGAKKLFDTDERSIGQDFLTVDRSLKMSRAVENALSGKHSEFREQRGGSEYQFGISPIESGGKTIGAVIICFDVSETAFAERNRQEFTANVSHELKTPLQSIIGSAELLENGLVKPEDTQRFIGNIRREATRLVSLINDIIRLSQLDENMESAKEETDLYALANEVKDVLTVSASKKNVEINISGESCVVNGVRRYLYEIIYNLCDNAIRYNNEGGRVNIDVHKDKNSVILTVEDNGIGIPFEHQSRIFERFYRVDKSHSKETGGTGLGLSIVKHAVAYHGGTLRLDSTFGKGTTITIVF